MARDTAADGIPFVTTTRPADPIAMVDGTSNCAETIFDPMATPIVLKLCVLQ